MSPQRMFAYGLLAVIILCPLLIFLIPEPDMRGCINYFEDRRTNLCFAQFACEALNEPRGPFTNVECTKEVRALVERGRK